MSRSLRVAYLAHSFRSDWNNGNAHFLRGLMRHLGELGHEVHLFEPECSWSLENLELEPNGRQSLQQFDHVYANLRIETYSASQGMGASYWLRTLEGMDFVLLHEWNPPELAHVLLGLRQEAGFRILFHDTHHRASSSPEAIARFGIDRFDGVLVFGDSLRSIYVNTFGIEKVWTLHEAADTTVFRPLNPMRKADDVVWIGNWGDEERSAEIKHFLVKPAESLSDRRFTIYGVRYPEEAQAVLRSAGVRYGGYLPNLMAPETYAAAWLTVHIPRQQYATECMTGIPTIRVFEALACGIPLISAPWTDTEKLFREGDYLSVRNADEMRRAIEYLLSDREAAAAQAMRGLETLLARHTCRHRAEQLTKIFEELLS